MDGNIWLYYKTLLLLYPAFAYGRNGLDDASLSASIASATRMSLDDARQAQASLIEMKNLFIARREDPFRGIAIKMNTEEQTLRNDPEGAFYIRIGDKLKKEIELLNVMLFDPSREPLGVWNFITDGMKFSIPFLVEGNHYLQVVNWQGDEYTVSVQWGIYDLLDEEQTLSDCFDSMQSAWVPHGFWKEHLVKGGIAVDAEIKWMKNLMAPGRPIQYWKEGNLITL